MMIRNTVFILAVGFICGMLYRLDPDNRASAIGTAGPVSSLTADDFRVGLLDNRLKVLEDRLSSLPQIKPVNLVLESDLESPEPVAEVEDEVQPEPAPENLGSSGTRVAGYGSSGYQASGYGSNGYAVSGYGSNGYSASSYRTSYGSSGYQASGYGSNGYAVSGYGSNGYSVQAAPVVRRVGLFRRAVVSAPVQTVQTVSYGPAGYGVPYLNAVPVRTSVRAARRGTQWVCDEFGCRFE